MLFAKRLGPLGVKMPCLVSNAGIQRVQGWTTSNSFGMRSGLPREDPRVAKLRGIFLVVLGANPVKVKGESKLVCDCYGVIVRKTWLLL